MKYTHELRLHNGIRNLCALTLVLSVLILTALPAAANTSSALTYLKGAPPSAWSVMAAAATGAQSDVSFLREIDADTAIELEAPILALTAARKDPRTYPTTDLVAQLRAHYTNSQLGDSTLLNDDIFGVLALRAAGVPSDDPLMIELANFIRTHQNTDGGFPYAIDGTSDTNTTAAAIQALLETEHSPTHKSIEDAFEYLRAAQNEDGGFPYDPQSPYGSDSDASSDAWVIAALSKADEDLDDWSKNGNTPQDHLITLQTDAGYFEYQPGAGENGFTPVTTSYAVIALESTGLPIHHISDSDITDADDDADEDAADDVDTDGDIYFSITGSTGTICDGALHAQTALAVIERAATLCDFTYTVKDTDYGAYISRIGDDAASGSYGWRYSVNSTEPMIGAGEYALETGDTVTWSFSGYTDYTDTEASSTQDVALHANLEIEATSTEDTIAFTVAPGTLDFGTVRPGNEYAAELKINNTGTTPIQVKNTVSGGALFREHLTLESKSWREWSITLSEGDAHEISAQLSIPEAFTAPRIQSGDLIFWAQPAK